MMELSAEETDKREKMLRIYKVCKEALKIVENVSMATVLTPVPVKTNDVCRVWVIANNSKFLFSCFYWLFIFIFFI